MPEREEKPPLERCATALERIADLLEMMMLGGAPQDGEGLTEIPDSWQRITTFSTEAGYEVFQKPDGSTIKLHHSEIAQ